MHVVGRWWLLAYLKATHVSSQAAHGLVHLFSRLLCFLLQLFLPRPFSSSTQPFGCLPLPLPMHLPLACRIPRSRLVLLLLPWVLLPSQCSHHSTAGASQPVTEDVILPHLILQGSANHFNRFIIITTKFTHFSANQVNSHNCILYIPVAL